MDEKFYVYARWSAAHEKIYVGYSTQPDARLTSHNAGRGGWTKSFRPWQRFLLEEHPDAPTALKREKYLKSGWGRAWLKKVLQHWLSGKGGQSSS